MPQWLLALLIGIPLWEFLRWRFLGRIRARFQRQALAYVRRHRIQLESGRFLDRVFIRQALQADPQLDEAIAEAARARRMPFRELEQQVESWIEEMAPAFSLAAYYRIGARVARWSIHLLYEPVFDEAAYRRAMSQVPVDSIVVFVVNHRSNADYVLLSYGLLKHMTLSYAVGEWARIWPLDSLFRAFGSFFIRRGEKDRLYHTVLERFVQLLVQHGGTMGFFPEGGLSRDGRLRPAKAGLLDYIVGIQRTAPDQEITFVPVALCYDHVLEDRWLIREQQQGDRARPPGPLDKLRSLVALLLRLPWLVTANLWRLASRSHRKSGYAAVSVGAPIRLSAHAPGLARLPPDERRPRMKAFAAHLLHEIARTIPLTPVPLCCRLLRDLPSPSTPDLVRAAIPLIKTLRASGTFIARGHGVPAPTADTHIEGLDEEIMAGEEAEALVERGMRLLRRRGVVREVGGRWEVVEREIVDYYANSD